MIDRSLRALLALALAGTLGAQESPAPEPDGRTVSVVAGEQFRGGGFHRFLLGAEYRDLWTTPVELPVLDLARFAGGLRPVRRLGHGQTKALALAGADGVAYTFRPILKDPVGLLPQELHETVAARVVRDQMASQHPAGHVVVPRLMEAVGLLHNTPRLVVMPDDPALGDFRLDFRNLAGDIEEFTGQKGYAGALELIDGETMWKRMDADPGTRVDAREFLKARLMDHLIGDWDRHRDQWRWARMEGRERWLPLPEDRDQAFVRFQGFLISFLRPGLPMLISFDDDYPRLAGLLFDSWDVDRRLLTELDHDAFVAVADEVQSRLADSVITEAVATLPKAWFDKVGPEMRRALLRRRDAMHRHAERYYAYLARQVEVRASEGDDRCEIERFPGGDVEVRLSRGEGEAPYFRRRFRPGETRDVRVYLFSGNDSVVTSGPKGGVQVRVIGGDGEDRYDDSKSGGLRISDAEGTNQVVKGDGTHVDDKPFAVPPPSREWIPARDWGRSTIFPVFRVSGSTDFGLVLGLGLKTTGYGFRKVPFANEQTLRVSFSTKLQEWRGEYEGRFRYENSNVELGVQARASGFEMVRFYGLGNETKAPEDSRLYRITQDQLSFEPVLRVPLGKRAGLTFGPEIKRVVTEDTNRAAVKIGPYGLDTFDEVGVHAGFGMATIDRPGLPTRGVALNAGGTWRPKLLSVESDFGEVHADGVTYFSFGPTLALRAAGKRVFGKYPFFEAAFLGGPFSLRGLQLQRYAGDAVVSGAAELYLPLAKVFVFVPARMGLMGLYDVGRVFLEGETSSVWHHGAGGGIWFSSPKRNNLVGVAAARSEGRWGVYARLGFGF